MFRLEIFCHSGTVGSEQWIFVSIHYTREQAEKTMDYFSISDGIPRRLWRVIEE